MSGVNKVTLIGRLGKDPEVSYIPSGDAVAKFSLATSETWKDKNTGEKQERTEWHKIVAWRRLGEICGEYLHKGSQVYIEGKLQTRSWEDDSGSKRYMTEVVAQTMQMLGGKNDGGESSGSRKETPSPGKQGAMFPEDDIPF